MLAQGVVGLHGTADRLGGAFAGEDGLPVVCCCVEGIELATLLNVPLAFVPIVVTAIRQMIMMSNNRTAYSTTAGPSSHARKRRMRENGCTGFTLLLPSKPILLPMTAPFIRMSAKGIQWSSIGLN